MSVLFTQFGVPVHELTHTIGLWHEMQRTDRDNHVRVLYENIGIYSSQFRKLNTYNDVEYDFSSVLHYTGRVRSISHFFFPIYRPRVTIDRC